MATTKQIINRNTGLTRKGNAGGRRSRYQTRKDAYNFYRRKSSGGAGGIIWQIVSIKNSQLKQSAGKI